jgi:hypothetical protein
MDSRFCAVCNRKSASSRPRAAIAHTTLDEILRFLNTEHIRATYSAVAEVLGVAPMSLDVRFGGRRAEASWIVNAKDGRPTDYAPDLWHPALLESDIITSGAALAMRMTAWKAKSQS